LLSFYRHVIPSGFFRRSAKTKENDENVGSLFLSGLQNSSLVAGIFGEQTKENDGLFYNMLFIVHSLTAETLFI
jgi:hypothetical protein